MLLHPKKTLKSNQTSEIILNQNYNTWNYEMGDR
jgi:hypothetical protein